MPVNNSKPLISPVGAVTAVAIEDKDAPPSSFTVFCRVICEDEAGNKWSFPGAYMVHDLKPYNEQHPNYTKWYDDVRKLDKHYYMPQEVFKAENLHPLYRAGKSPQEAYEELQKISKQIRGW